MPVPSAETVLKRPLVLPDGLTLDEVFARLQGYGMMVSFDRRLRAYQLFAQLEQSGTRLERADVANWCASLFCSTRDEQDLVRQVVLGQDRVVEDTNAGLGRKIRLGDKQLFLYIGLAAALVVAGFAALFADLPGFLDRISRIFVTEIPDVQGPVLPGGDLENAQGPSLEEIGRTLQERARQEAAMDGAIRFLFEDVLVRLYALFPWAVVAWIVLQGQGAQQAALQRREGKGRKFSELSVPLSRMAAGPTSLLRRATERFKTQRQERGTRLDVDRSLRAVLASPGAGDVFFRMEKRNIDYLMLVEGRDSDSLRHVLYERMQARFEQSDTPYAMYELGAAANTAVFRAGRRDGVMSEQLDDVLHRYRGGRLILCGTALELWRRDSRQSRQARIAALVDEFDVVLAFVPTPQARWGASEAALVKAGVRVFECSDAGYVAAGAQLVSRREEGGPHRPVRQPGRDDPFLKHLWENATRYCSDIAPDPRDVDRLVRQTRGYLATPDAWRLFAAHCAVPRFDRAMSLFLAERITGTELDDATVLRLSALPWFRDNRIPDWMRLAVLRALEPGDQADLSRKLQALFLEILGETDGPLSDQSTDVLIEAGVTATLIDRLGLGASVIEGEGVFLRFLKGDLSDDLEQDVGQVTPAPSTARLVSAAAVLGAGLLAAPFVEDIGSTIVTRAITLLPFFETVFVVFPVAIYMLALAALCGGRITRPWSRRAVYVSGVCAYLAVLVTLLRFPGLVTADSWDSDFGTSFQLHLALAALAFLMCLMVHVFVTTKGRRSLFRIDVREGLATAPAWLITLMVFGLGGALGVWRLIGSLSNDSTLFINLSLCLVLVTLAVLGTVLTLRIQPGQTDSGMRGVELVALFFLHYCSTVALTLGGYVFLEIVYDSPVSAVNMTLIAACLGFALMHRPSLLGPTLVWATVLGTWAVSFSARDDPVFNFLGADYQQAVLVYGDTWFVHAFLFLLLTGALHFFGKNFMIGFRRSWAESAASSASGAPPEKADEDLRKDTERRPEPASEPKSRPRPQGKRRPETRPETRRPEKPPEPTSETGSTTSGSDTMTSEPFDPSGKGPAA